MIVIFVPGNLGIQAICRLPRQFGNISKVPRQLWTSSPNCLGNQRISPPNCLGNLGISSPNCLGNLGISSPNCLGNLGISGSPNFRGFISKVPWQSEDIIPRLPRQFRLDIPRLPRQFGDHDIRGLPRQFGDTPRLPRLPRQSGIPDCLDSQITWNIFSLSPRGTVNRFLFWYYVERPFPKGFVPDYSDDVATDLKL